METTDLISKIIIDNSSRVRFNKKKSLYAFE
jgi:hypothetical protein